jgi:FkbM family methyltransferase
MIDRIFRFLPRFKGKHRIARLILSGLIKSGSEISIVGKFGCRYKLPNTSENIGFEILINGIYEEGTIRFIVDRIKKNGIMLDIGANIGAIAIPVSKLRSDIETFGVEAAPWIFDYLQWNVEANGLDNVKIINKAVSNLGGEFVDFFSPKDKFGKGSFVPVFTSEAVRVETISLDDWCKEQKKVVDFIKLDVEGFEYKIFEGGSSLLNRESGPDILFEFVDWAEEHAGQRPGSAQEILFDFGYRLYLMQNGSITEQLKSSVTKGSNLIFATKYSNKSLPVF